MVGNPRTETIDERIVRALNLDSEFEMSYEEYSRHLKEAMIASRMAKSRYSSEESMLFSVEFKRVRGKKGRFIIKVKKTKITASGLGLGGFTKPLRMAQRRLMLAPSRAAAEVGAEQDIFTKIDDLLASILSSVTEQNKETKKQVENDRKEKENKKRKQKELGLEKGKQALKNIVSTITKPFKSILDKIINFFVMTFLGRAVFKLLEWFSDPKNKDKIKTISKFLKDWWPALLGAFVLFGTRFGKGVRVLTRIAITAIAKLGKASVALLRFAKNNPISGGLIAAGAVAGTQLASRAFNSGEEQGFWGGGFARKLFASGGRVSGPGGIDKVPAWLTNGEFVMSKGAVDKFGVGTLEAMNAAGGGTNVPTIGPGGVYAQGGGLLDFLPGTGTVMAPTGRELGYQDKLLGFDNPFTSRRVLSQLKTYRDSDVERYNKMRSRAGASDRLVKDMFGRHKSVTLPRARARAAQSPTTPSRGAQPSTGLDPFRNFGRNVQTIQSAAQRQEEIMAKYGHKPSGYVGIFGQPVVKREMGGRVPESAFQSQPSPRLPNLKFIKQKISTYVRPLPKRQPQTSGMIGAMPNGNSPARNTPTAQEPPISFNAIHPKGTRIAEAVYGVRK